jgi:hypothetical protein
VKETAGAAKPQPNSIITAAYVEENELNTSVV